MQSGNCAILRGYLLTNRFAFVRMRYVFIRTLSWLGIALVVSSCASQGIIKNSPLDPETRDSSYSLIQAQSRDHDSRTHFTLALSGGGTRAAAFAYGVLGGLRDTPITHTRLLDELDTISSVSGGSFTAAYYGLHGDGIFRTFDFECRQTSNTKNTKL